MRATCLVLGVIGTAGLSLLLAKLDSVTLREFREVAPCGLVVKVTDLKATPARELASVEEVYPEIFSDPRILGTYDAEGLIFEAIMSVRAAIGGEGCRPTERAVTAYFSSEEHSSHPKVDELAVAFLRPSNGRYYEAVYGRSYWRIVGEAEARGIEVGWRNDFLLEDDGMAKLPHGAVLPLAQVLQLFGGLRPWGKPE